MDPDLRQAGVDHAVRIGLGGHAVVYWGRQPPSNREVAVKVLEARPGRFLREEFERERVAIGALSGHPNVVTVHGSGLTAEGHPYIVMEYVHGGSLAARLAARGPLPWRDVVEIGIKLSGALEVAHRSGVLHRDVKPENVLMSRFEEPKLCDFGIAQLEDRDVGSHRPLVATLLHAAPEVLDGKSPTASSDVYSLGSTLFTLLAGKPPFIGDDNSPTALLARMASPGVPDLRRRGVPDQVCRAIESALARDARDRPGTAEAFGRQLQACQTVAGIPVTPFTAGANPSTTERATHAQPARGSRRVRWLAASAAVAALGLLVVVLGGGSSGQKAVFPPPSVPTVPAFRPTAPGVVFSDDFSDSNRWVQDTNDRRTLGYVDGSYFVRLHQANWRDDRHVPIPGVVFGSIRVEVDATFVAGGDGMAGMTCSDPMSVLGYHALIGSDGKWVIVRQQLPAPVEVTSSTSPGQHRPALRASGANRLRLDCVSSASGIVVTFSVNDDEVVEVREERRNLDEHVNVMLMVESASTGIEVRFDNLVVTRV